MEILAILGALQGVVLLLFFTTIKKNKIANRHLLIGILLSITQMLLFVYVENPFEISGNISLKLLTRVLVFPIPVFFYFYFRFLVSETKSYHKWDFLHAFPTLIATLILALPYLNSETPKAILTTNIDHLAFAKAGFYFMFIQSVVIILYAKLSFYSIHNLHLKVYGLYAKLKEKELSWLRGVILSMFLVGLSGLISAVFGMQDLLESTMNFSSITHYVYLVFGIVSISFYWVGYKAIRQPEIFRELESLVEKKEKYSHSVMDEKNADQLAKKLLTLITTEKVYLNPALKLTDVATPLEITPQLLSQLLNQHFQQNFYDFINVYRIDATKSKLLDPNFSHLSIQGIALESGFKSKSTFYSLFKKQTGMTPTQFQKK